MSFKPSSAETIQADVEPGNKTGIYYITICNLPFGLTWRELKDWLRQVCTVDHIELFPTSTSGWIRLHGQDNFENAWRHINTADFQGRSIIASDKNRTESIKIKELVEKKSTRKKSEGSSSEPKAPCFQTTSPTRYEPTHYEPPQPAPAQYSAPSYDQHYGQSYPQSNAGASYSTGPVGMATYNAAPVAGHHRAFVNPYAGADPWSSYSAGTVHGLGYMEQHPANVMPPIGTPYGGAQYAMPYHSRPGAASYSDLYTTNTAESTSSGGYIPTEARKVLVTSLPPRATPEEAEGWIRRKTGALADDIWNVDVPPHETRKGVRGHAYIIFKSAAAAQSGVELLDQVLYMGRAVSARFTIEGVTSHERRVSSPPAARKDPPASRRETKQARDDGSKSHQSKHKESASSSRYGYGYGYGHSKPKSDKKETNAPEKKEIKAPEIMEPGIWPKVWPIVADGSSRRPDKQNA